MTFADRLRDALAKAKAAAGAGWNAEKWAEVVNATAHAEGIAKKRKPKGAARARNPLFDALALATGTKDLAQLTRNANKAIAVALADIKEVSEYVTPEEIQRRAQAYRQKHPTWPLTAPALAKHWGEFALQPHEDRTRAALLDPYQEREGWRPYGARLYPDTGIEERAWNDLPLDARQKILKEMYERPAT